MANPLTRLIFGIHIVYINSVKPTNYPETFHKSAIMYTDIGDMVGNNIGGWWERRYLETSARPKLVTLSRIFPSLALQKTQLSLPSSDASTSFSCGELVET
jgi:hypothetical protein